MSTRTTSSTAGGGLHRCSACSAVHATWAGRCGTCGEWNTVVAQTAPRSLAPSARPGPTLIGDVGADAAHPVSTTIDELDRVLGGGLVPGSVTLLGGEPGIGKSTLLLQLLAAWPGPTLYVTAEESAHQVRLRGERLEATGSRLWLHAETSLPDVLDAIDGTSPEVVAVDSIQTVADPELGSVPGSVGQVRGCAQQLVDVAKTRGIAVVLVGHVTKDGNLAGPRVLEHLVDTVLQFEGDRHHALRLLRASKHRFGPTGELGLFEMASHGLVAVPDPSAMFLADRRPGTPGSAIVPTVDGDRPLVVEVQALTSQAVPGVPARRTAQGVDGGRTAMLVAVLGRRCGERLGDHDVYVSAVGGARLVEPGADLGVCLSVVSARRSVPLPPDLVVLGEVGLGGEIRQVAHAARRLSEAARLGFRRAIVPTTLPAVDDIDVVPVADIRQAVAAAGLDEVDTALRAV